MIPPSADIQLHSAYKCPFCVNCHEMWRWTWSRIEREMGVWPFTELNCNIVDDEEEEEVRESSSVCCLLNWKVDIPPPSLLWWKKVKEGGAEEDFSWGCSCLLGSRPLHHRPRIAAGLIPWAITCKHIAPPTRLAPSSSSSLTHCLS
jgi:hypothetical protein